MSSMELPRGDTEAKGDRIKAESEELCAACEQVLWVSFFFDGFGHTNRSGPPTNIVKLYDAAFDIEFEGIRAFYYPGLGADFDPETAALAAALGGRAVDQAADKAQGAAKGKAKSTAVETATDAWERSKGIRNNSTFNRAVWTAGEVWDETVEGAGRARRQVARVLSKPRTHWNRAVRGLRREWQQLWGDVMRNPWKAVTGQAQRAAIAAGVKVSVGYVAESVGVVRDQPLVAALFNTGVDTRLASAQRDFEQAVRTARQRAPVAKIHVALFGYDMGGGLALAFSNRLLEELCAGGFYEQTPVQIKFMGLFDCVTNRYDDNFLTGYIPLSNDVSSNLKLLPKVERCVHYAAAHELRFYKPLTMIGADPSDFRGPRQEKLFPGSQVDVGGGVVDGEDGVSDKLSRLPLQMMYHRAWGAGVPMPELQGLRQINPRLHASFDLPPEVEQFHNDYRRTVKQLVTQTREIPPLAIQMGLPVECGITSAATRTPEQEARCAVPAQPIVVTTLPKDIEGEQKGHAVIFIHWLRIWHDHNRQTADDRTRRWGLGVPVDSHAFGRYQKLSDELDCLERNARSGSGFSNDQAMKQLGKEAQPNLFVTDPQGQALYWLWNNPGSRQPAIEKLYPMFARHVHDSMAECLIEAGFGDLVYAKHYFNNRAIQKIATEPDKTILERLQKLYENLVAA
ncbi:phospholipase effector Tle1 domain-containing protein [Montanilutibacter psychrotolerans]|uniref:T6SS Phospholipase effector Tle1-like catalytic domain-containing protein n=1 Tax=Montanilutibacter psychrotolerans TaxID=1327343 RepID=A0A3M8SMM5_9GAMM|nr:DUF2235 domain-containing protein [Lysobacter psychrotolerans]RNF82073.1 hypothetical protein EER27_15610 [Lysobacter psychrotolerans]